MDIKNLEMLCEKLEKIGRLREIQDDEGKIEPTKKSLKYIEREYPDKTDAEKWRLAQAETLLDLAKKYQSELN